MVKDDIEIVKITIGMIGIIVPCEKCLQIIF